MINRTEVSLKITEFLKELSSRKDPGNYFSIFETIVVKWRTQISNNTLSSFDQKTAPQQKKHLFDIRPLELPSHHVYWTL